MPSLICAPIMRYFVSPLLVEERGLLKEGETGEREGRGEIKITHFFPRGADQFPQTGSRYFPALVFLVLSTAPKRPASGSLRTAARFTREQLLLPL